MKFEAQPGNVRAASFARSICDLGTRPTAWRIGQKTPIPVIRWGPDSVRLLTSRLLDARVPGPLALVSPFDNYPIPATRRELKS